MPKAKTKRQNVGKYLVIVESPTKTKTIGKYLGDDYTVISSKGHIIDLPTSKLGIDTENNFLPQYEPLKGKKTVIKELQECAKEADQVYLATDLDREGEAIAWHIAQSIGALKTNKDGRQTTKENVTRVVFAEITKTAIAEAFANPRGMDFNLVDAYQARRVLDRLVGYKLSPLLWKKIQYGLSAGRVQSIALRLVVERENERERFQSEPYFKINVDLGLEPTSLNADLVSIDDESITFRNRIKLFAGEYSFNSTVLRDQAKVESIATEIKETDNFIVISAQTKSLQKSPPTPFTTATLQRAAATRLHLTPKQTMMFAQKLYEEGFITYHRTDSVNLSKQFLETVRSYIKDTYGNTYLPEKERLYGKKQANAQEAHEAIRPTAILSDSIISSDIASKVDERAVLLYQLIQKRALACQMTDATYQNKQVGLTPQGSQLRHRYLFNAQGSILVFDGYLRAWGRDGNDSDIPDLAEGETLPLKQLNITNHATAAPPRYTEASLIKEMETHGIGRPSTYAPTIGTITDRNYVMRENGYLSPTDTGRAVSNLLTDNFPKIVDLQFTAKMELDLDEIATGNEAWQKVIADFYGPFAKELEEKDQSLDRKDYKIIKVTDEPCPECNDHLVLKLGKYGKFYSCGNFPTCKFAKPYIETIGLTCPDCKSGEIIVKRTRHSKLFYGCSRYPECQWASWDDPRKNDVPEEKPTGVSEPDDTDG